MLPSLPWVITKVWQSAFPGLFRPQSDMPPGLVDHLRYPEELFRIQTAAYSKYQLPPSQFFDRNGAWSVAQAPPNQAQATSVPAAAITPVTDANDRQQQAFSDESGSAKFVPYYSMFQAPGVQVVARVPVAGPVPPPNSRVLRCG